MRIAEQPRTHAVVIDKARAGRWMQAVREHRGMTRELVALRAGVEASTVAAWELGRATPYVWTFIAWSHAVGMAPGRAIEMIEGCEAGDDLPRPQSRRCPECRQELPSEASRKVFCGRRCRQAAFRERRRMGVS